MAMIYLILPAYDEEKNLVKIFRKINNLQIVKKIVVILIDDCSIDNTKSFKLNKYKFKLIYKRHLKNMGLSGAIESGFKIVKNKAKKNDLIITMDSDNTHPIKIIPKMTELMKKNNSDIVIASRFLSKSKVNGLSFFRQYLSIAAKYIFSYSFPHNNLKEYTCNFRIYKSNLIKKLMKNKKFFKNEDFNIAVKILLFMIKNNKNLKIIEYPLILNYHYKIGSSKMSVLKNIFLTLKLIVLKKF
jgi:dolichol-phosphate mannosyltransferase